MSFIQFIHSLMQSNSNNGYTLEDAEKGYMLYCEMMKSLNSQQPSK